MNQNQNGREGIFEANFFPAAVSSHAATSDFPHSYISANPTSHAGMKVWRLALGLLGTSVAPSLSYPLDLTPRVTSRD